MRQVDRLPVRQPRHRTSQQISYVIHHHNIISLRGDMSGEVPMAMLPRLWSLNGLAVELRLDRRTVARKMAQVRPDGLLAKKPAWFLSTAAPILIHEVGNGVEPKDGIAERAGGPFSMGRNPVDEGICTVLVMLAARLPAEAAVTARRAGASPELAEEIFRATAVRTCALVDEIADQIGIVWASEAHFDLPPLPDWRAFRERDTY